MKLPAFLAAMLSLATIVLITFFIAAASIVKSSPPSIPQQACEADPNLVLGKDFGSLLASSDVALEIVQWQGRVSFEWTSRSEARLNQVLELGQHLYDVKRRQEVNAPKKTAMR